MKARQSSNEAVLTETKKSDKNTEDLIKEANELVQKWLKKPFRINGIAYKIAFSTCAAKEIQKRYNDLDEWFKCVQSLDADAILYGAMVMLNEYALQYNEANPEKQKKPVLTLEDNERQIGRLPVKKLVGLMCYQYSLWAYGDE